MRINCARASNGRRESKMPVKIFCVEGNELIGGLESEINKWQKSLGSHCRSGHGPSRSPIGRLMAARGGHGHVLGPLSRLPTVIKFETFPASDFEASLARLSRS